MSHSSPEILFLFLFLVFTRGFLPTGVRVARGLPEFAANLPAGFIGFDRDLMRRLPYFSGGRVGLPMAFFFRLTGTASERDAERYQKYQEEKTSSHGGVALIKILSVHA